MKKAILAAICAALLFWVIRIAVYELTPAPEEPPVEETMGAVVTQPIPQPEPEPVITIDYPGLHDDALYAAKTIYGEGSYLQPMEKAAIVWCVCNRVDSENAFYPDTVSEVITQPMQFQGYDPDHPVTEENLALAVDVLTRWAMEKAGAEDVGRVLPADYLYFMGDLEHNHYTTEFLGTDYWDWSLPNPYEEIE